MFWSGRIGGAAISWGQGTRGGPWGSSFPPPQRCCLQSGVGTSGGCGRDGDGGPMGAWPWETVLDGARGHRAVGLMGCGVTGWGAGGAHGVQCGWLGMGALGMGQGWLGCWWFPVLAAWLDAVWHRSWQGIAVTPVSPVAGVPQTGGTGGRVQHGSQRHDAVGSLCPSGSGHLPTWGSRLGWHWGRRRLVTTVSAALTPGSCAASQGAGCLPAGRRCCSPRRSPRPPRDPSVCACTQVPEASLRGRLCHMEPRTPGTPGVCVKAGAGTCAPWPWGRPPASPAPGTHWAAAWKATGWARVLCMSEPELLGCGRSPQPDTASPVTHHPRVPDSQVMKDGVAPPSIPACAASGPAAGTREGDRGRVRGARHPQAPGCLAVPAAVPALSAKARRAGGRRVACQSGGVGG